MLKYFIAILVTFPALACSGFLMKGKLAVDGQSWKIERRMKLGQEEIMPAGPYIVSMTFSYPESSYRVRYKVEEKIGNALTLVTTGEEDDLRMGKSRDIMARGEKGQPHSILTLELQDH